ncbi:MAG TPA: putative toxin-antitoxin system toxin component, PIN family [Thermomicrobiales bacterium]|nr:putative toxin-antitoxin system toxin component, PIN family [Thermomicrobiales bacterium]
MIRAVVDANVFASGVLGYRRSESAPGEVFRQWQVRAFVLVTSAHLIAEVERTLADPFFTARIPPAEISKALESLKRDAELTALTATVSGVASHPEDDLVLAAAVSATADILVTGDKQLQRLAVFREVAIVGPRDFLRHIEHEGEIARR